MKNQTAKSLTIVLALVLGMACMQSAPAQTFKKVKVNGNAPIMQVACRRQQRLGARQQWQPVHLQREKSRIGEQYLSKPNCSWRRQCGPSRCSLGAEFFRQYLPRQQKRINVDLLPSSRCP